MDEKNYKQRTTELGERVCKLEDTLARFRSGEIKSINLEEFEDIIGSMEWVREEVGDILIELEVEDFLKNGAGRVRDKEYIK